MEQPPVLSLSVLDHRIDVDLTGVPVADRPALVGPWARCVDRTGAPAAERWAVAVGVPAAAVDLAAPTVGALAEQLTMRVTLAAIAARRGELLMLHAGAVADPATGAVVAYVGASGAGKTTASVALGRGLAYLSDETAAVRDDLTVVPYPKPLSVIRPGSHHRKEQVGPDELGLLTAPDRPLRLVGLVLLDRDEDHPQGEPPRVEQVTMAEVAPQLLGQVSYLAEPPRPLHRVQALLEACGGLQRITYREADGLPATVARLLAEGAPRAERPRSIAVRPAADHPRRTGTAEPGTWVRTPLLDSVEVGGALVVLQGDRVTVLDGIGPTLHGLLEHPATQQRLVAEVVERHGRPEGGDADDLVRRALEDLRAQGLVELRE